MIFYLRNYSSTHDARFFFKLSNAESKASQGMLAPTFSGRLTRRGTLKPSESTNLTVKLWITHPGAYSISGWRTETEVLEPEDTKKTSGTEPDALVSEETISNTITTTNTTSVTSSNTSRRVRHRYTEGPALDACTSVIVVHRI